MADRSYGFISVLFLLFLAIEITSGILSAEILYLNDGSVLKGSIIKEGKTRITIKNENGEREINLTDVKRILYGNNDMEKIFIITISGKTEKGYMVDQDDDKIIIRKDPASPQEKIIPKKQIRQISRDEIYPIDLELSAKASWFMPLDSGGADIGSSLFYTFGMGFNSMISMDFRFLLETGFTRAESPERSSRYLQIIPITLSLTSRFDFLKLGFIPRIGAGIAMLDFNTGEGDIKKSKALEGIAGVGVIYSVSGNISLGLSADYAVFYDGSDYLQSTLISFSVNYKL